MEHGTPEQEDVCEIKRKNALKEREWGTSFWPNASRGGLGIKRIGIKPPEEKNVRNIHCKRADGKYHQE